MAQGTWFDPKGIVAAAVAAEVAAASAAGEENVELLSENHVRLSDEVAPVAVAGRPQLRR